MIPLRCLRKAQRIGWLILQFCVLVPVCLAQEPGAIEGTVVDAESGDPLVGVNVFLSSRLQGASTDLQGAFSIRDLAPGSYKVVASFIGYESASVIVELENGSGRKDVNFSLKPRVYELEGVVVSEEEPREWRRQLKRFEESFLGSSDNAKFTEIRNAYVLSFREDGKGFEAFAGEPLEIENRNTGYRIVFVMERFVEDSDNELRITAGTWRFEELQPENEKEKENWLEQRELTFKGSLQHLLWSMVHLRTEAEGFSLLRDFREGSEAPELFLTNYYEVDERTILSKSPVPYEYKMQFPDFIRVHYIRTGDRKRLFARRPPPAEQLSYLKMNTSDEVTVHESGYMYTPAGTAGAITAYGYLAALGIADLLPQEYALQRE